MAATPWTRERSGLQASATGDSDVAMTGARSATRRPRALVTGGAGFIGSHLCERLLSEGCRVVCMDNLSTGVLANVTPFLAKGARFMLASTSEVDGAPLVHPQREDYRRNVSTTGPRSVYDEAKRYAEALTMAYHRHHRIDTRIVRIFNSYGPKMREDDGRMVPNFMRQALLGEPLTVYGDGTQTRSVQYIEDLIEGVIRLMKSEETRPVNIGNPVEYTVREVAEMIIELSGSDSEIVHRPLPADDPRRRRPDIDRAREVLGWEPRTAAREGLRRTLHWFSGRLANEKMEAL